MPDAPATTIRAADVSAQAFQTGLPGTLLDNGYILPPDLTFAAWQAIVALIEHIVASSPWWLVDAIEYGHQRFGEEHTQAFPTAEDDPDGTSQARLKQAAWMATRWPQGTRVPEQSYSAHRAVAKLNRDDATALLEMVDTDGRRLTVRELVKRADGIEVALNGQAHPVASPAPPEEATITIPLTLLADLVRHLAERFTTDGHLLQQVHQEHRGICPPGRCARACLDARAIFLDTVARLEQAGLTAPGP